MGDDLTRAMSEERVWWLRDLDNLGLGPSDDYDRVYLRLEGDGGIQSILITISNGAEKKNHTIAFTVVEFDMLINLLSKTYGDASRNKTIFNGRRRVLMENIGEERVQFTLFKYSLKNDT